MALPVHPLPSGPDDPVDASPANRPDARRELARSLARRIRPPVLAREARLEVAGPLGVLVDGGVARGSTVAVEGIGATSLALGLTAAAATTGSWCVVVGLEDLAPVAVLESGIDPARVAFIDVRESGRVADVIGALVGAVDLVLVDARLPLRPVEVRRVGARSRERGTVVVVVRPDGEGSCAPWSADLVLSVRSGEWCGPGRGEGHLRVRHAEVEVGGRGRAARSHRHALTLPASG